MKTFLLFTLLISALGIQSSCRAAATVSISANANGTLQKPENFFDVNAAKIALALSRATPTCLLFHFDNPPPNATDFELKAAVNFDGKSSAGYVFGFYSADPQRQLHTWQVYTTRPQIFITDSASDDARRTLRVGDNSTVELTLSSPWSQAGSLTVLVFDGLNNPDLQWVIHWLGDQDAAGNPIWRRVFPRPLFSIPNLQPNQP